MGVISIIGGCSALRLPETLHYRLPKTVEEGEQFGKDFSVADCLRCIPIKWDFFLKIKSIKKEKYSRSLKFITMLLETMICEILNLIESGLIVILFCF